MVSQFWENQAITRCLYASFLEPVCRKYQLTRMELAVLLFLANNPQFCSAADIVEHRQFAKSHVSMAVKTLSEKGYLTKSHAANNRKTICLSICDSAAEIVQDGQAAQKVFIDVLFRDFTPEDVAKLTELLTKINTNITSYSKEES